MGGHTQIRATLDRIIRVERGRLLAGLVSRFGAAAIDLADDAVQDALIEALQSWSHKGLPENPGALLMHIAGRRMIDRLRKQGREKSYDAEGDLRSVVPDERFHVADIKDPELRLIALCCHPILSETERLTLTVKLVSGFTANEISGLFLVAEAAIGQRVARGLRKLKNLPKADIEDPLTIFELQARLPAITKTIYLLYTAGYSPRNGECVLQKDVCLEALRLSELLFDSPATRTPASLALTALLCLQSARLSARISPEGDLVLLRDQDRSRWDRSLIEKGLAFLKLARNTGPPSTYHVEAAIAAAHIAATSWEVTDWAGISALYAALEAMTHSPVVAVNRCVAQAMAGDPDAAYARLDKLAADARIAGSYPIHLARAEILTVLGRPAEAKSAFALALSRSLSQPTQRHIKARLNGMSECGLA